MMAEKGEGTLLDKFNAMFGKVEIAQNKIFKAQKLINNKQYKVAVATLKDVLVDLRYAYRLSLHRRSRRLLKEFRTLEALKQKRAIIDRNTATLQVLLEEIRSKIEKIVKAKNDEDIIKQFKKLEKKNMEDVKLLFSWSKKIVDQLEDVPKLEEHWAEALSLTGLFGGADKKVLAEKINEYLKANERIHVAGFTFKSFINRELLGTLIFDKCNFECNLNLYSAAKYLFDDCNFKECKFTQTLFRKIGLGFTSFKNCKFIKVSGSLEDGNKENCNFYQCHNLDIFLKNYKSSMESVTFSECSLGRLHWEFMMLNNIEFDSCNINEIELYPTLESVGFEMKPTNLFFKNCNIKTMRGGLNENKGGNYEILWFIESAVRDGEFYADSIKGLKIFGGDLGGFKLSCRYEIDHSSFTNMSMDHHFFPNIFSSCTFDTVNFSNIIFKDPTRFNRCHFNKCLFEKVRNKVSEDLFVKCIGNPSLENYFDEELEIILSVIKNSYLPKAVKDHLIAKEERIEKGIREDYGEMLYIVPEMIENNCKKLARSMVTLLWHIAEPYKLVSGEQEELYRNFYFKLKEAYERQLARQEARAKV